MRSFKYEDRVPDVVHYLHTLLVDTIRNCVPVYLVGVVLLFIGL